MNSHVEAMVLNLVVAPRRYPKKSASKRFFTVR
jgi:hypothetical protein